MNNMEMSASISSIISHFLIRRAEDFALKWIRALSTQQMMGGLNRSNFDSYTMKTFQLKTGESDNALAHYGQSEKCAQRYVAYVII